MTRDEFIDSYNNYKKKKHSLVDSVKTDTWKYNIFDIPDEGEYVERYGSFLYLKETYSNSYNSIGQIEFDFIHDTFFDYIYIVSKVTLSHTENDESIRDMFDRLGYSGIFGEKGLVTYSKEIHDKVRDFEHYDESLRKLSEHLLNWISIAESMESNK